MVALLNAPRFCREEIAQQPIVSVLSLMPREQQLLAHVLIALPRLTHTLRVILL